jgi:hypothetical protein
MDEKEGLFPGLRVYYKLLFLIAFIGNYHRVLSRSIDFIQLAKNERNKRTFKENDLETEKM